MLEINHDCFTSLLTALLEYLDLLLHDIGQKVIGRKGVGGSLTVPKVLLLGHSGST